MKNSHKSNTQTFKLESLKQANTFFTELEKLHNTEEVILELGTKTDQDLIKQLIKFVTEKKSPPISPYNQICKLKRITNNNSTA